MPSARPIQNNLSAGELSPEMYARSDLPVYGAGMRSALNMIPLPQGGVTRRSGFRYIGPLLEMGQPFHMAEFEFSPTESYVMVFTHLRCDIYRAADHVDGEDVFQETIVTPWPRTVLDYIDHTQSYDTMVVTHEDYPPHRIIRDATVVLPAAQFSIEDLSDTGNDIHLTNIPLFDFGDGVTSPVDEVQRLTFSIAGWANGDRFRLSIDGIRTERIVFSSVAATMEQRIQTALRALTPVSIDGITVVQFSASPDIYDVTFGGDDGARDWPPIEVDIIDDIAGTLTVTDDNPKGGSAQEPVWSVTRGWPKHCVFHNGRLVFGGSKQRPATQWASKSAQYFNFDTGDALDSDAINVTLDRAGKVQDITGLSSGVQLEIFTSKAVFVPTGDEYTPQSIITAGFSMVTDTGSSAVEPVRLDGATVFIDPAGRGLHELALQSQFEVSDSYGATEVSLLAQHLVKNPVDMTVQQDARGDYLWLVNDDGTMSCLNRNRQQNLSGMTPITTQGLFERAVVSNRALYVAVERVINSVTVRYLERLDPSVLTDSASVQTGSAQDVWTGLGHLEAEEVELKADGIPEGTFTVASGQITSPVPVDAVEIGLAYQTEVIPMPPVSQGTLQTTKRVSRVWVMLQQSADVYVNGYRIADRFLHADAFDEPPELLDGHYDVRLRGYSREPLVTITQQRPMPLTVLAITQEVGLS